MAIISGVKYTIDVEGNSYINDIFYSNQFVPTRKIERSFTNITSSAGEINIPLSGINTLNTLIVQSTDLKIRLYNISGIVNTYDIDGVLLSEIKPVIASGLVSMTIETSSLIGITAKLTLIGVNGIADPYLTSPAIDGGNA